MIITCPCKEKKFEIDKSLIPEEGRTLQCGSCGKKWFYNLNEQVTPEISKEKKNIQKSELTTHEEIFNEGDDNNKNISISEESPPSMFQYSQLEEIDNTEQNGVATSALNLSQILSYFVVFIISFIALVIILDTFQSPLSDIFPGLEFLLYNLFESLKDVFLFTRNLLT